MQLKARDMYEEIYASTMQPPLYGAPWWLNASCGIEGWDVFCLNDQDKNQLAFLPYQKTVIRGMKAIVNPPMTQWLPMIRTSQLHQPMPSICLLQALHLLSPILLLPDDVPLMHSI